MGCARLYYGIRSVITAEADRIFTAIIAVVRFSIRVRGPVGRERVMEFNEITLNSRSLFDSFIRPLNPEISEMTFTNFFAWRYYYKFRYKVIAGLLCIIAAPGKIEPFAMMPLGDINEENFALAYEELKDYFTERVWKLCFRKLTRNDLEYIRKYITSDDKIIYDRDNSDYLYYTEELINLRGKKYDGKRNHINKFKKQHEFEYVPLECHLLDECSRIMEEWCREKNCSCQEGDYCERSANLELLRNFRTLGCKGALIKVDGDFEAFTVGETLNDNTAVIHIEKAKNSIDGLFTLINQQFLEHEWSDMTYVNREQDLGLEGMRRAKLSYHPVSIVEKFTVYPDL